MVLLESLTRIKKILLSFVLPLRFKILNDFRCFYSHFRYFYALCCQFAAKCVKIVNDSVVGFTYKDRRVW